MELLVIAVLALLAIAGAAAIGPKLGVASPLLLVLVGIGVSLLPEVPPFEVDPEWIIAGVLPPLLYSAAVSMPTMEFRRDFTRDQRALGRARRSSPRCCSGCSSRGSSPTSGWRSASRSARSSAPPTRSRRRSSNASECHRGCRRCSTARACSTTRARSCCCVRRSRAQRHPSRSGGSSARSSTRSRSPA